MGKDGLSLAFDIISSLVFFAFSTKSLLEHQFPTKFNAVCNWDGWFSASSSMITVSLAYFINSMLLLCDDDDDDDGEDDDVDYVHRE